MVEQALLKALSRTAMNRRLKVKEFTSPTTFSYTNFSKPKLGREIVRQGCWFLIVLEIIRRAMTEGSKIVFSIVFEVQSISSFTWTVNLQLGKTVNLESDSA